MDPRYRTELADELTPQRRVIHYLRILAAVARAQHDAGIFNEEEVVGELDRLNDDFRGGNQEEFLRGWREKELEVRHDTAAFVDYVRELLPDEFAPYVYLGMTSSDLVDTADAIVFRTCASYINTSVHNLIAALGAASCNLNHKRRGRTHGRLAEPVKVFYAYYRTESDLRAAMAGLLSSLLPGKISGPVGEYNSALSVTTECKALDSLMIRADETATQTVNRRYYADAAMQLIRIVGACEQLATLHRASSIEGVNLFAEGFAEGQKGSSVMAYKKNPMRSERICGLARVCRGHLSAILETAYTQWWERDLTNSSVERTAFWDLVQLTHYIVLESIGVVENGAWLPDPHLTPGFQSPVEELIRRSLAGQHPEEAYRTIQSRS